MIVTTPRRATLMALFALVVGVGACTTPRPGPTMNEIFSGSVLREGDSFIIAVNDRVTRATSVTPALGFSDALRNAQVVGGDTIRPGDLVTLTVFENVPDGLLASSGTAGGSRAAVLEDVQVDDTGHIFVPFAGRIRAAGQTPDALRRTISRQLDEQTPDPQVVVRRTTGDGATVSVVGRVTDQGVYPI